MCGVCGCGGEGALLLVDGRCWTPHVRGVGCIEELRDLVCKHAVGGRVVDAPKGLCKGRCGPGCDCMPQTLLYLLSDPVSDLSDDSLRLCGCSVT